MLKQSMQITGLVLLVSGPLGVNAETMPSTNTAVMSTDSQITTQVKAAYLESPVLKNSPITVQTMNHTVMLTGSLDTNTQYAQAVELAQAIADVRDVNADKLTVKASTQPLTDTYYTAKVKGVLLQAKLFGDKSIEYWPVSVETKNSVVYLTGVVDTQVQLTNIVNLVQSVKGITSVKSTLTVK